MCILFDIWRQPAWLSATRYKVCACWPLITGSEWASLFVPMLQLLYKMDFTTLYNQVYPDQSGELLSFGHMLCNCRLMPSGPDTNEVFLLSLDLLAEPLFNSRFMLVENVTVGKLKREKRSVHSQKVHLGDANARQDFVRSVKGLIFSRLTGPHCFN